MTRYQCRAWQVVPFNPMSSRAALLGCVGLHTGAQPGEVRPIPLALQGAMLCCAQTVASLLYSIMAECGRPGRAQSRFGIHPVPHGIVISDVVRSLARSASVSPSVRLIRTPNPPRVRLSVSLPWPYVQTATPVIRTCAHPSASASLSRPCSSVCPSVWRIRAPSKRRVDILQPGRRIADMAHMSHELSSRIVLLCKTATYLWRRGPALQGACRRAVGRTFTAGGA